MDGIFTKLKNRNTHFDPLKQARYRGDACSVIDNGVALKNDSQVIKNLALTLRAVDWSRFRIEEKRGRIGAYKRGGGAP